MTTMEEIMLTLSEIKDTQLLMLEYIDDLCRKNGINYSLAYGSLIGAVRHNGFIPWDDDIDIMLKRADYEKLLKIITSSDNKYKVLTYNDNWFNWAKLCDSRTRIEEDEDFGINDYGVWIDIFPLDEVPAPESLSGCLSRLSVKYLRYLSQIRTLSKKHVKDYPFFKKYIWLLIHGFLLVFPKSFFSTIIEKVITRANGKNTSYIADCNFFWSNPNRSFPAKVFDSYCDIRFESIKAMCIEDYDYYLKSFYGDYMKLPPVDQQITNHSYRAFWKD